MRRTEIRWTAVLVLAFGLSTAVGMICFSSWPGASATTKGGGQGWVGGPDTGVPQQPGGPTAGDAAGTTAVVAGTTGTGPAILSLDPVSAARGVVVTITGRRFGTSRGTSVVRFGRWTCRRYVSWGARRIRCRVPAATPYGALRVRVVTRAGASNRVAFTVVTQDAAAFTLASSAFTDGGTLPMAYTADGAGVSPPLAWSGAPAGTEGFALMMTTLALDGEKWNWVLYDIPADVTAIAEGATGVGTTGLSSDGPDLRYYPPASKGPGPKTYTFTVYALSGSPTFAVPAAEVSGPVLTTAIASLTLAKAEMSVTYTRVSPSPEAER